MGRELSIFLHPPRLQQSHAHPADRGEFDCCVTNDCVCDSPSPKNTKHRFFHRTLTMHIHFSSPSSPPSSLHTSSSSIPSILLTNKQTGARNLPRRPRRGHRLPPGQRRRAVHGQGCRVRGDSRALGHARHPRHRGAGASENISFFPTTQKKPLFAPTK